MADLSSIGVSEVTAGTTVRVTVSTAPTSKTRRQPQHEGLYRVEPGGKRHPLQKRDWRRLVGLSRRKFVARVLSNDTVNERMTLEIQDARTSDDRQLRYVIVLAYTQMVRLARLVQNGREFATNEAEQAFRNKHRQTPVEKAYFHPTDRFVAVSLIR
jgi:hypothetical protein